jgi:signal transduction histidine kinase
MPVLAEGRPDRGPDRRWIAVPVLAAGLLVTAAVWRTIGTHEQSELSWATKLAAQAVRSNIRTDMEWQMVGLDRLALLWEAADPPQELWIDNAHLYLEHRPGSVAVEWLSPSGERRVLVTRRGNSNTVPLAFDGLPRAVLSSANASDLTIISNPVPVSGGRRQWAIVHPVSTNGQPRGFVVSFFDFEESWDYILDDLKGLGFSYAALPSGQPEYLLPGSSREHEQDWGEVIDVPLPGVTWQVRVWPKSDVVNAIKSELPQVALGTGSALSVLLALTLYFAFGQARSSARTRRANQALMREIGMREAAQEELLRAQAELETRIDQRTAELAAANMLLQKEVGEHERAEESLRELTGRLFQLQDEERRRLARELHDGAGQNLVALTMNVGMIRDGVPADDTSTRELLNECVHLIEQSTSDLRTISYLLHPPYFDELGLATALRDFVAGFTARSGIHVTLDIDGTLGRLGHEMELAIYRVAQEALSNVYRHARSRTATVALVIDGQFVRLEIADAGRGIPPEVLAPDSCRLAGVGITGMRERVRLLGGSLEIQSSNAGTRVLALIPRTSVPFRPEPGTSTGGAATALSPASVT